MLNNIMSQMGQMQRQGSGAPQGPLGQPDGQGGIPPQPQGGPPEQLSALMNWIMQLMKEGKPIPPMIASLLGLQGQQGPPQQAPTQGGMPQTSYQR